MRLVVIDDDKTVQEIKDVVGYWYWTRAEIAEILAYDYEEEEGREELEKYGLTFDELVDLTVDDVSTMENCPDADTIQDIADEVINERVQDEDEEEEEE